MQQMNLQLAGKHIVLGLSGGIACYKSAELCRLLIKEGATVQVVMTESATHFITPTTMQALSKRPVFDSQWDARNPASMAHIDLGREADAIVIAPCSADFLEKLAHGRADELLSLLCLARPRNRVQVEADGAIVLDVGVGEQACGETGDGRMLEPEDIVQDVIAFFQPKVLKGQHVLVSAGPTFEPIDPVRGITNHSSGKMGFAIARAAQEAGAKVTLVAGPVALTTPRNVKRVNVQSANDMLNAVLAHTKPEQEATIFIATAAVADWRPANTSNQKIKKEGNEKGSTLPAMEFVENTDILATVAQSARAQAGELFCVGFAAESHDLLTYARAKRIKKGIPLLVGNIGPATFGKDDNALLLVDENGEKELPHNSKLALARQLVREIAGRLNKIRQ
jgi:phosphopantothenoylcysteine decarboxylase/phosphopantothenate--cysteine ligase